LKSFNKTERIASTPLCSQPDERNNWTMTERAPDWQATRWSLLARLKNWEDQQSWRESFDAYWKLIYSVARKAGLNDAEAQDVVQDTILSVAKKIKDFQCDPEAGSFKAWLLTLTRWRILNQVKKRLPASAAQSINQRGLGQPPAQGRQSDQTRTATVERVADPVSLDLSAVWEAEWAQNRTEAARTRVQQQVSAKQFQIFELSVVQGWPVREITQLLGVSAGQVYLARHRVGRLLKKELKRLDSSSVNLPNRPK
jgi:RNA polymerase sigma-70 factor (ECF subfamily)